MRCYTGGYIVCLGFNKYSVYLKVVFMKETFFGSLKMNTKCHLKFSEHK